MNASLATGRRPGGYAPRAGKRAGEHAGPKARAIRNVAEQDIIKEKARDMVKKTADGDWLSVEFPRNRLRPGADHVPE